MNTNSGRAQRVTVTSKFGDAPVGLGTKSIRAGRASTFKATLKVAQPRLWSPPDPQLYDVTLAASAVSSRGSSQPHGNVMPFLCVSFIISLFGIFPSQ